VSFFLFPELTKCLPDIAFGAADLVGEIGFDFVLLLVGAHLTGRDLPSKESNEQNKT